MNDVSRRTVLKAGALGGVAVLGWHAVGAPWPSFNNAGPRPPYLPVVLPKVGETVVIQIGDIVRVSPPNLVDGIREYAHERLERSLAEWPHGWEMIEPETEITFFEATPGSDFNDPLQADLLIGAKQSWKARRIA